MLRVCQGLQWLARVCMLSRGSVVLYQSIVRWGLLLRKGTVLVGQMASSSVRFCLWWVPTGVLHLSLVLFWLRLGVPQVQSLVSALLFPCMFLSFCLICPIGEKELPYKLQEEEGRDNFKMATSTRTRSALGICDFDRHFLQCLAGRVPDRLVVDNSDIILISGGFWLVSPLCQRPAWPNLTLGRF